MATIEDRWFKDKSSGEPVPTARHGRGGRWRVHYRTPAGQQRNKTFRRKIDAEHYLTSVESAKLSGTYVDPARAKVKLGVWADEWLAAQGHLKPSTRNRYVSALDKHVRPRWASVSLSDVRHAEVQQWVSDMTGDGLAPQTVRNTHRVLSLMLELAVRDGRIPNNPAAGVRLPRAVPAEKRFLSAEQVEGLADAALMYPHPVVGASSRTLVLTLAYTGLRWGEAVALRVGRVDLLRRRLAVAEAVTEVNGRMVWGTPKTHQRRSVPFPRFLVDLLAEEVAGKGPDDLVFTTWHRRPLRNGNWRRDVLDKAAADVGLEGLTPHELRHTAASLAVSAGANVKGVQAMLGHKSAAVTLDVYAALFDDDLDAVAERLDEVRVSRVLPRATVLQHPAAAK